MDKQFQLVVMLHNLKDRAKLVGMMMPGRGVVHTEYDLSIANSELLWREAEIMAFFDQCLAEQGRGGAGGGDMKPEGFYEDIMVIVECAKWLAGKGVPIPPDSIEAINYAYVEALENADATVERYRKAILHSLELLDEAYKCGVGEESAVYLTMMETELRESLAADGKVRTTDPAVARVEETPL